MKVFTLCLLMLLMLAPSAPARAAKPGDACTKTELGTSKLADDEKNIIACLRGTVANTYFWKNMTYSCVKYSGFGPCACPNGVGPDALNCLSRDRTSVIGPQVRRCSGDCYNDCEGAPFGSAAYCNCIAGLSNNWSYTECD